MKTFLLIASLIIAFLLFFNGCIVNITGDFKPVIPGEPGVAKLVSLALLAIYEVVVRLAPTVGDYSLLSWTIKLLKKISDTLNIKSP